MYKNSFDCCCKLIKKRGFQSLFQGLGITLLIEVIGCGVYLGIYFSIKEMFNVSNHHSIMMIGGLTGCLSFLSICCLDPIKTKIMSREFSESKINYYEEVKQIINKKSKMGIVPALTGSFISNSFAFLFYELSIKHLNKYLA